MLSISYGYNCSAYKYSYFLFDNVEVPVLMEDTILQEVTPVSEGANVTLVCLPLMTYPPPMITWLADGSDVQVSSGNYTFGPVNESGIYQCLVEATFVPSTNRVGLPLSISLVTTTLVECKSCVICDSGITLQ